MEQIEGYFGKRLSADEAAEFERRILDEPDFAEEVAFYLSARTVAKNVAEEEIKERFREIYLKRIKQSSVRRMVRVWVAAAAVLIVALGLYLFIRPTSPDRLADKYIGVNLQRLGVSMSAKEDSVQQGLDLFNEGKYTEALTQFENIIGSGDPGPDLRRYAGICALRMKDYDKALNYFKQLARYKLYANPGVFYQAVTLMERNHSDDPANAKRLLQQVVDEDLAEKETAREWLKKF